MTPAKHTPTPQLRAALEAVGSDWTLIHHRTREDSVATVTLERLGLIERRIIETFWKSRLTAAGRAALEGK